MTILLEYSPKYVPQLPPRLQFQFLFCQFWYPLFAVFSLLMFVMPLYALATDSLYANVNFPQFILYYAPNSIMLILIVCMLKWFGLARPYYAKSLSWEGTLFLFFARWPWVIWGTISAMRDHVTKSFVDFRVTPKGNGPKSLLPLRVSAPYMVLAGVSTLAVFASSDVQHAVGFYWFAAFNAFLYGVLVLVILIKHLRENRIPLRINLGRVAVQGALGLATAVGPVAAFRGHGLEGIYGLQYGAEPLRLVRVSYPASGAGRGGEGERFYTFDPAWITPAGDLEEDSDGQEI
jgi:hypothetical protein